MELIFKMETKDTVLELYESNGERIKIIKYKNKNKNKIKN